MSTETAHEPASTRQPLDLNTGTDKIAGILSREPEAPVETAEAPEPEVEMSDAPDIQAEVSEPETDEPTQEVEATDEPAKEEPEVTSEEIELEPAQVAQMLGLEEGDISVDEAGAISLHAKVDGKPATVSLKDLRQSYQLAQTHEERLRDLGRERKAFQEESQAHLQRLAEHQGQMDQMVQALEAEYAADFQNVDWNTLRLEDPTEYNAKRMDYEDRRKRLEEYRARSHQQAQQLQGEFQQKLQETQAEGSRMLAETFQGSSYRNVPKWGQEESEKLAKWIMDQGFSAQDVSSVGVWQVFKWARDSMLREQELKAVKETVKKVAKLPKVTKPGTSKAPREVQQGKVKEMKKRQRKSGGGLKETTDLIAAMFQK
jgi:hypothetical protein